MPKDAGDLATPTTGGEGGAREALPELCGDVMCKLRSRQVAITAVLRSVVG